MSPIKHLTTEELEAGLETIRQAPADFGSLKFIVRRRSTGGRRLKLQNLTCRPGWWAITGKLAAVPAPRINPPTQGCKSP